MRSTNVLLRALSAAAIAGILLIAGCTKDAPQGLYDPNAVNTVGAPAVTSVVPEGAPYVLGGITTILINGSGFPTDTSQLNVYFNSVRMTIASATATQLKIVAPNMILDSIKVRIFITGSEVFSDLKYVSIRSAFTLVSAIDTSKVYPKTITTNKQGDLFVSVILKSTNNSDGLYKVSASGVQTQYALRAAAPLSPEANFTGLKAKGDSLYAARGARLIVSRNSGSGAMNIYTASFPSTPLAINVDDFDYDANRYLWAGGSSSNGGLLRIDSHKVVTRYDLAGQLTGTIRSVRVFNGAVFVSNESSDSVNAVYRIPINADTTLGTPTKYFDLTALLGSKLNKLYGLTFDNSGNLYVGTDAPAGIYVVAPDKSVQPLYNGLFGSPCKYLAWGNDSYMYASKDVGNAGVYKIDMLGKLSAPYYGQ